MTEGVAWFISNNEGYNNPFNYVKGMDISTLIMGSSHMESINIMVNYNTANLLNKLLGKTVYNIGISGHDFIHCSANLKAALKKYKPQDYVVIETASIEFSQKELNNVLENRVKKIPAYDKGILSQLRRNNFLRLIYAQFFQNFLKTYVLKTQNIPSNPDDKNNNSNPVLLSEVLRQMAATVSSTGAKLIIAYHPSILLNKDGSMTINENPEAVKVFSDACKEHGIYFINTGKRFLSEYEKNYTLPYGFFNTSVGTGHMNKYGHRMFAEEIYKLMQRIEGK